jgi:preprotein translocase subunit YajC
VQAALVVLAAASKSKTTSSSPVYTLLFLVIVGGALYLLFLRPRAQRQRKVREQVRSSQLGDKVVTIGGLVGTIVAEDGDQVTVSTGNGTEVTFLRQAIGRKLDTSTPEPAAPDDEGFCGPPPGFESHTEPGPDPEGHPAT